MTKTLPLPCMILCATIVAGACASASSPPGTSPSPSPAAQPAESLAPTQAAVPTIRPTPSTVASFDERLIATVDIKYPDELVLAAGHIWVKTDDGRLVQVDPASNEVVGEVKLDTTTDPAHYCQGLATDGQSVWACSAAGDEDIRTIDVVRVDPRSRSVVGTAKVGKVFDQFDMPSLLDRVWVLTDGGRKLVGIDTATDQPGAAIDLGEQCFQLAAVGTELVASCQLADRLLRIDPVTGEVTAGLELKAPRSIAANQDGVWVAQDSTVARLDPASLAPVVTFTELPGVGATGEVFLTDDTAWVRLESGFLYRIAAASNEVLEQISTDRPLSGGSIIVTPDSIWTTAAEDDLLIRLSLD